MTRHGASAASTATRTTSHRLRRRAVAAAASALLGASLLPAALAPAAQAAPVGQGFNLNASDLRFILKQVKVAEAHVVNTTSTTGPCGALLGNGPNQIPSTGQGVELPWGLRTVDGTCNNLVSQQNAFGSADQKFPRLVPKKLTAGEGGTSYTQTAGTVRDTRPRVVSNLIVDQTAGNPAAVEAAGPNPPSEGDTLVIPNTAPDTGLSAPYNSWFTLFGQFFDHGLDLVNKGGNGSVLMALKPDDPLYNAGPDGVPANADDPPTNFMRLTRASHGGDHEAVNQTSPFIDQSQTYSSHPSHQVFLREYHAGTSGPVATGALIEGAGGGMATWAEVKAQASNLLGIALGDADALNVPLLATDPYGRFVRGPNGLPQMVHVGVDGLPRTADDVLVEGNLASPVNTSGVLGSGHAFLDDIAHTAVPSSGKTPDADTDINSLNAAPSPTTYDDEMLAAHFIAGDGRVNENIGLISVHHVFHSEHNRLVGNINDLITGTATEASVLTPEEVADWQVVSGERAGWDYGERLFQAARFVTEMQYQHLAFEEFGRKVQPMINVFGGGGGGYRTEIDPAITAEFAHSVYRFGHSMLTETVDRVNADGTNNSVQLLDAFLNPPSFMRGYPNADAAAGAVVRGMTRQVGNEIDEFVTEALRNRLLGLPLDLAALNIARGRDTGVPTLNAARRGFYRASGDPALVPYTSWADFGHSMRHATSLPNFMAAYGTHPTITGASTVAGKRAAAVALLEAAGSPDPAVNADPLAFINSTGAYASVNGVTTTGLDDVELWAGGLAEKQMVFGGLLGPTFNYVFETQLENLQDGDRFYYLSRTAGLNLLVQLEGNSFAEMIQRNTDVEGLPADSFSRPGLIFNLANLGTSGPIPDDTSTPDYDESRLLIREPDGTIRYTGPEHVVFNGTANQDRMRASEGDDTLRGNDGNDRMEGGDGVDSLIGGLGDDILTDLNGDDTLKGGDGNDAMSSGKGFGGDLNQGGRGKDFIVGGNDITETFAGPGDDMVMAGDSEDTVFGDDGDDWIEGGKGPFNQLNGDNGAPFQDDANEAGHDVLDGDGGEQDFDAEGGDDVMLLGPGIQRSEGMRGHDWATHKGDTNALGTPNPGDSDVRVSALLPPTVVNNRDRFDLVESLSGWHANDQLRGDSRTAEDMNGHELTAAGVARIAGLSDVLPAGATSFNGGNIILGGGGDDLLEGRGGDDILDGDRWLDAQLELRNGAGDVIRTVDNLAALRADVLDGSINPGDLRIVRSIKADTSGSATDTALFTGPRSEYTISVDGDMVRVAHTGGRQIDGVDRMRNVESLRFSDQTVLVSNVISNAPAAGTVTVSDTTPFRGQLLTATSEIVDGNGLGTVTYLWERETAPAGSNTWTQVATGSTYAPTATDVGSRLRVAATFTDGSGFQERINSAPTAAVIDVPGPVRNLLATSGDASATLTWDAPASDGGAPTTGYRIQVRQGNNVVNSYNVPASPTSTRVTGLTNGLSYTFTVSAMNEAGTGAATVSNAVTPFTPDATAPTVTATNPVNGATGFARSANVTATFSEAMAATSINGTTFQLRVASSGALVAARVTYNATTRVTTLDPSGSLLRTTRYTATLTSGVTDAAGNPLSSAPVTWSFTTGR